VLGGFATEAGARPLRSSDGTVGDEAIADAVRSALREDSSTTDLQVDVAVEGGVVRLFGTVAGLEDVDNAEAVAGRVPGVVDVVEELQVAGV
jgi:osmotically-inducible protein OsmY